MGIIDKAIEKAYRPFTVAEEPVVTQEQSNANADEDYFWVRARRCKRCGGILLSEEAQRDGMGHHCKEKYALEHPVTDPNQIAFEDEEYGEISQKGN